MKKGFTLIELLIVMAILGVLAVVVLIAINPVQQLARTRDTGRKSGVTQLGHALEAYFTARNGNFVPESATWIDDLVAGGELSTDPSPINYGITSATIDDCAALGGNNMQNLWCYDLVGNVTTGDAIVYVVLESASEIDKCAGLSSTAWFVFSSADGRSGLVCTDAVPAPGGQSFTD